MALEPILLGVNVEGGMVIIRLRNPRTREETHGFVEWSVAREFSKSVLEASVQAERIAKFGR